MALLTVLVFFVEDIAAKLFIWIEWVKVQQWCKTIDFTKEAKPPTFKSWRNASMMCLVGCFCIYYELGFYNE